MTTSEGIAVYNYEGRLVSQPKQSGLRTEFLSQKSLSISNEVLAVKDTNSNKLIRLFDIATGKALGNFLEHSLEIVDMSLNHVQTSSDRKLAFVDSNKDLFLTQVHRLDPVKLASMCDSLAWHDHCDMLTAFCDGKLCTWLFPNLCWLDRDLLDLSKFVKEAAEFGGNVEICAFTGNQVIARKIDGSLGTLGVSP